MENKLLDVIEYLGLEELSGADIYGNKEEELAKNRMKKAETKKIEREKTEEDFLYKKTYHCPVCGTSFQAFCVKSSKPRFLGTDPDMRPIYQHIDVNKYDCVACEKCGYAALAKNFDQISDAQIRLVRAEISSKFRGFSSSKEKLTYDEAIMRCQLALANSIVKRSRVSERAYICLKLAWLYRGKRNELVAPTEARKRELYDAEMQYLRKTLEGFKTARMKESFPIAGMDEWTFTFLMAELCIECNDLDDAKKLISFIIISKNVPNRVKDRARDLRDYINDIS